MAGGPYNQMDGAPMGMQPQGMQPQGMQPQGAPPQSAPMMAQRPQVMRRGTSRAVPIVVSAGLAIGTFCGLLFGLGTGGDVIAAPSKGTNAGKMVADVEPGAS